METLVKCGFCFLKELSKTELLMENKFTGLRIIYNHRCNRYLVLEEN